MNRTLTITTLGLLVAMSSSLAAQELKVPASTALDKKGMLEISGSGFKANEPVLLLFTTADGVTSEIGYALKPEPVADTKGNWSTQWSYGRFVKKKLVAAGDFTLSATDDDFNELAATKIKFQK